MDPLGKEQLLHKVIAVSGFLFALAILPLSQYFLVTRQLPAAGQTVAIQNNSGQVAGVSTAQSPVVRAIGDVPQPTASCPPDQVARLASLDSWMLDYSAGQHAKLQTDTAGYRTALQQLGSQGSPTEISAVQGLIDERTNFYQTKIDAAQKAVASQKEELSKSCSP